MLRLQVKEYIARKRELDANIATFEQLLSKLPKPLLVTIARSVRNGYTPRTQQQYIERGVLQALQRVFGIGPTDVNWDSQLVGGRRGWFQYKIDQLERLPSNIDHSDFEKRDRVFRLYVPGQHNKTTRKYI